MKTGGRAVLAVLLASLCACDLTLPWDGSGTPPDDGGGGGGGGGGGQPGAFTLDAYAVSFVGYQGGSLPAMQTLTMRITGPGAAFAGTRNETGSLPVTWLDARVRGTGTDLFVDVSIVDSGLPVGAATTAFTVATYDANGITLARKDVAVTYTVKERITLSTANASSQVRYGDGRAEVFPGVVGGATGKTWTAATDVAWLSVPAGTRTGSGELAFTLDSSGLLPGRHLGNLTVTNGADATDSATVRIDLTVSAPVLTVSPAELVLGGADGLGPTHATLTLSHDGASAHPFSVVPTTGSGGGWLGVSPSSGTASGTGASIAVDASRGALAAGTYTGSLRVTVTVGALELTTDVPITFNAGSHRIWADASGVGFSSTPARSVLARTVKVHDSFGRDDVPWSATSDQPWLTVTPSGLTGQSVTLTANPAGLTAETTHFATVTLSSAQADVENTDAIRVGLFVTATAPTLVHAAASATFLVESPVEPLVFLNDGGTDVVARNVFTGEVVRTFSAVVSQARRMVTSGDGRRLFVYDKAQARVTELDAETGSIARHLASPPSYGEPNHAGGIAWLRPGGHAMLLTPSARFYDLATGRDYTDPSFLAPTFAFSLFAAGDGTLVADFGGVFAISRTELGGGRVLASYQYSGAAVAGREGQACIRADGAMLYTASGGVYDFKGTSTTTRLLAQTLPAAPYPNSMLCPWNGLVVGGSASSTPADVWVYAGDGTSLGSFPSGTVASGLLDRGLAVSADGTRLISVSKASSWSPEVTFRSLPAPP